MKKKLETLEPHWGHTSARGRSGVTSPAQQCEQDAYVAAGILKALQPHQNLKKVLIKGYPGTKFPRSLHSLQTLNMRGCCNLERLPNLSQMFHLRHLILTGCEALTSIPFNIEELPQLQTLPTFIVDGYYNGIQHLEHVNLHGELKIKHLQNVWNAHVASSANLRNKETLSCWDCIGKREIIEKNVTTTWCPFLKPCNLIKMFNN